MKLQRTRIIKLNTKKLRSLEVGLKYKNNVEKIEHGTTLVSIFINYEEKLCSNFLKNIRLGLSINYRLLLKWLLKNNNLIR